MRKHSAGARRECRGRACCPLRGLHRPRASALGVKRVHVALVSHKPNGRLLALLLLLRLHVLEGRTAQDAAAWAAARSCWTRVVVFCGRPMRWCRAMRFDSQHADHLELLAPRATLTGPPRILLASRPDTHLTALPSLSPSRFHDFTTPRTSSRARPSHCHALTQIIATLSTTVSLPFSRSPLVTPARSIHGVRRRPLAPARATGLTTAIITTPAPPSTFCGTP
jgi:hypothetical protein